MPKQLQSFQTDTIPESKMILRVATVRAETANDASKSIEVVIASENPVERYDVERGEVIREILAMDGVQFRNGSGKLPIVDSHDRSTTRNVLGSVRNIRVEGTELVGDATFARDADSQNAYQKLVDGHLDDFSITATPHEIQSILRGETGVFRDEEIQGPTDIVSAWMPTDASLVAVGADETSTQRSALLRSYDVTRNPIRKVSRMTDETRAALVGRGMDENATDEEALEFAISKMAPEENVENMEEENIENMDDEEAIENADDPVDVDEVEKAAVGRALKADKIRRKEIGALVKSAGIKRAFADQLCDSGVNLDIAREKILERIVENNKALGQNGTRVEVTADSGDRTRAAMRDGLISRAMSALPSNGNVQRQSPFKDGNPAEGHQDFARMGLLRMAEEILRQGGINTTRLTPQQIAFVAMGHKRTIERLQHTGEIRRDGNVWHTTGTLSNLMLDAQNKTLLAGYEESPVTWQMWARQAPSAADLRTIYRTKFSEAPDPSVVPEGKPYPEGKTSDAKESYKIEKYGEIFSVTWETIVNDDLDALSRIPQMHGAACRRKQNKVVYAVLTDNAAMADEVALFHASHSNLAGSGAVISETTLNAAYAAMMVQTNLGGEIINVVPRYLIVPAAISATALQTMVSVTPPTVGGSAAGTSGTVNLYGPNGARQLQVVPEPQLDSNSATAWYLAAENSQVDTVELTFLQGEESPVLEQEWDFDTDTYKNKVRQTFAAAAIDHRGLYKNPGA